MRKLKLFIVVLLTQACTASLANSNPSLGITPKGEGTVRLGFITGCWRAEDAQSITEERWDNPGTGMMLGTSKTFEKGSGNILNFEFLMIRVQGGALTYQPFPNGRKAAVFKGDVPALESVKAVFESPENDFPKRISYHRLDNALNIILTGDAGSRPIEFQMQRVNCSQR